MMMKTTLFSLLRRSLKQRLQPNQNVSLLSTIYYLLVNEFIYSAKVHKTTPALGGGKASATAKKAK